MTHATQGPDPRHGVQPDPARRWETALQGPTDAPRSGRMGNPLVGSKELVLEVVRDELAVHPEELVHVRDGLRALAPQLLRGDHQELFTREVLEVAFDLHRVSTAIEIRRITPHSLLDRRVFGANVPLMLVMRANPLDGIPDHIYELRPGDPSGDAFRHPRVAGELGVHRGRLAQGDGSLTGGRELPPVPLEVVPGVRLVREETELLGGGHEDLGVRAEVLVQAARPGLHGADHEEVGQLAHRRSGSGRGHPFPSSRWLTLGPDGITTSSRAGASTAPDD